MIEQILTRLALPTGMLWLGMAALSLVAWRAGRRRQSGAIAILFVCYGLVGNAWVSTAMSYFMERDYRQTTIDTGTTYDAVVILGGGTGTTPSGHPQLDAEGDRIMLGARLYHRRQAGFVICTGKRDEKLSNGPCDATDATAMLLTSVGVPENRIIRIGGENTAQELREVKQLLKERDWQNVGLITSAWHMRRAVRLARKEQLELHPLPADFHSYFAKLNIVDLIPNSTALRNVDLLCRELLATLVGR